MEQTRGGPAADPDADEPETERTRAFFGPRAAGWEDRFPGDEPAYAAAVEALAPPAGGVALDAACGTGRAVPFLRRAVGPSGTVIAVDVTPEMLAVAAAKGRAGAGALVQADVGRLPLADRSVDAILAAGLIGQHGDAHRLLGELARVARPGATLALFHPISRAALAARHGTVPDPGDVRADPAVRALLAGAGWEAELVDDGAERYLVVGRRR